jgi:hypothetical protein
MNRDIIYEIFRILHLDGYSLIARRLIFSQKKNKEVELRKVEKPIVFIISGSEASISRLANGTVIYWGDGNLSEIINSTNRGDHKYEKNNEYTIRIFGIKTKLSLPRNTIDIYSIGEITDMSELLMYNNYLKKGAGRYLDTTDVTSMHRTFVQCKDLDQNIGLNWNTSNVRDMSRIFEGCIKLNRNIGKNWDTSKVRVMSYMFAACWLI